MRRIIFFHKAQLVLHISPPSVRLNYFLQERKKLAEDRCVGGLNEGIVLISSRGTKGVFVNYLDRVASVKLDASIGLPEQVDASVFKIYVATILVRSYS